MEPSIPFTIPVTQIYIIPRCGICGFELLTGDRVAIVDELGAPGDTFPFLSTRLDVSEDGPPGRQYLNSRRLEDWDIELLDVGCHAECIAREPCTPSRARFAVMAYSYHPRLVEVERRERWYRSRLGVTLHGILNRRFSLPLEVCEHIASYCDVRAWAAAASRAFWDTYSTTPEPKTHRFNISSPVWARYVEFEGVRYVAQLTNEPGDQLGSFTLLYTPTRSGRPDRCYVAQDYLGIREVLFVSSPAMPAAQRDVNVWWKRLKVHPDSFFEAITDLVKIRSILVLSPDRPYFNMDTRASHLRSVWEQPPPPREQVHWHDIFSDPGMMRMTSFVCNRPGTTAYSVCCDSRPYTICAHAAEEHDLSFYSAEDLPERHRAVWLYTPIAPDERVAEVWVRLWETDLYSKHAAIVLRTDQNRTVVLGPHPADPGWGHNSYTLVYRADEKPGRLHFDTSLVGLHELALVAPLPAQPAAAQPPLPQPVSPCPRHYEEDENYFYTVAVLDGVVAVTPCQSVRRGIIVGLLLHYDDGRQASLGQVRLDWLQPAIKVVDPAGHMWFRFVSSPDGCPNVDAIGMIPPQPSHDAEGECFVVSWCGTLEWWFSHRQCRLWHENRSSPPTVRGTNPAWGV